MTDPTLPPPAEPATANRRQPGIIRRVVDFPLVLIVLGLVAIILAVMLVGMIVNGLLATSHPLGVLIANCAVAAAIPFVWRDFKRWVERVPHRDFSRSGAAMELGGGLMLGAGLFALAAGLVILVGDYQISGIRAPADTQWAELLGMAIMSGVLEETLFRALIFHQLERLAGSWFALAVTSLLFGLAHLTNDGATLSAAAALVVEAGVLLGAAYMLTGRLWLAIGIHTAWNFTQGWVFSIPVSGGEPPIGLFISRSTGPDWLSGGAFGLEASLVALGVSTVAGLTLLRLAVRRGRIVPFGWLPGSAQTKL
ncbi:CPBP family intramembrane metalloprotease [Altererythrobacter xixiisoli]|uniref:CPBP family intramembrane metalloprotease n=1 Tax=Croceibacterium xixiisoli TaxID=1476466 RepID=A0A6I4TTT4_9SPHN|nr:type II CAAX endopeptidase family protein [Croceibacterium xixiisoli]MXO99416.1 CPBP family intramembrane metalloprotease [Croceibacterium xixiisoli]